MQAIARRTREALFATSFGLSKCAALQQDVESVDVIIMVRLAIPLIKL
jgi:hypothetical protein